MESIFVDFIFLFFSLGIIGLSVGVVLSSNPVHGSMMLAGSFFCTAIIFFILHVPFIAIIEIIVYAGAIMVLFSFVVMMVDQFQFGRFLFSNYSVYFFVGISFLFFIALYALVVSTVFSVDFSIREGVDAYGKVYALGEALFRPIEDNLYIISFELISILILISVVGAMVLVKRFQEPHVLNSLDKKIK